MSMLATLLIGSPKGPRSVSDALGTYLLEQLKEHGVNTNKLYIQQALVSDQGTNALLSAVTETDIIILAAPLYADSHHSGVIKMMELVHENQNKLTQSKRQIMTAISNSGFPEARHNDVSLAISRKFAMDCGFEWAGGLALGGGQSLSGQRLEKAGGKARNVKKALDLAAAALAKGEAIPEEAVALMAKPMVPKWLYLLIGNIGWYWQARKKGCSEKLDHMPYRGTRSSQ
jgi:hypothetical protein